MIVHENRGGVESFYAPDTMGSTVALLNSSGVVTDTYTYWPYGEIRSHVGSSQTPFTFLGMIGYYTDVVGNFIYVRARYLRQALARWQSVDPLWYQQPAYSYAHGNPELYVDPSGMYTFGPTCDVLNGSCDDKYQCCLNGVGGFAPFMLGICGVGGASGAACLGICVGAIGTGGTLAIPCLVCLGLIGVSLSCFLAAWALWNNNKANCMFALADCQKKPRRPRPPKPIPPTTPAERCYQKRMAKCWAQSPPFSSDCGPQCLKQCHATPSIPSCLQPSPITNPFPT